MNSKVLYYNLDQFSILGRSLYIVGWCRDYRLRLYYAGEQLPLIVNAVERSDVALVFDDPAASKWGFVASALLPTEYVDRSLIKLEYTSNISINDPAANCAPKEDMAFLDMQNSFIADVRERGGSLLEIGSRARSGNSYRSWFPADIEYTGFDITDGPNVDVVGDAHHISEIITKKFDFMFSISVFEHILMPWKVAIEMNRAMNLGGRAFIASHASFPLHDVPWDFWRFSTDAWKALFNKHTGFTVLDAQYRYPAQIVPRYVSEATFEHSSLYPGYFVSGCVIEKTGEALVEWCQSPSNVYDMNYSHA